MGFLEESEMLVGKTSSGSASTCDY